MQLRYCVDRIQRYRGLQVSMEVTSGMEEQELVRPFQVYVRCHSPRPNLLNVESIKPCITRFISRRIQTAAQTKDWNPHFIGSIGVFFSFVFVTFLKGYRTSLSVAIRRLPVTKRHGD